MKKVLSLFLLLCVLFCLCSCSKNDNPTSDKKVFTDEIFKTVLGGKEHDAIYSRKLDPGVKGVNSDETKLALVKYRDDSDNVKYNICIADYTNVTASVLNYGNYSPLKILYDNLICKFAEGKHIENLDILYDYITIYGTDCLKENEPSRLYMRRLTSKNSLINTDDARELIKENQDSILPGGEEMFENADVIFEYRSAVPEYFTYKNPSGKGKDMWCAMNADFKEVDTPYCATKEEITEYLSGDNSSEEDGFNDQSQNDNPEENKDESKPHDKGTEGKNAEPNPQKEETDPPNKKDTLDTDDSDPSPKSDILYRVRKSPNDSSSQLGAFTVFENAKSLADANKDDGYKVYDQSGNLIYTP